MATPANIVLVTGATGFIGAHLCAALTARGVPVRGTWHRRTPEPVPGIEWRLLDLDGDDDPGELVRDVDVVVHLGARAHVIGPGRWRQSTFDAVNVAGSARLARAAARAGVRRFIYLGSIGAHGRESPMVGGITQPLHADDPCHPADAYAHSKLAGERAVQAASQESSTGGGMETVVLRVPLVFGPGVGGNFLRLLRLLDAGIPIPVGPMPSTRTLMFVDNLGDAITRATDAAGIGGRTFLVGDFDMDVPDLARRLAGLLGRTFHTLPLPAWLLRGRTLQSLTRPLIVDSALFRAATGWRPAVEPDIALARTVAWYRESR